MHTKTNLFLHSEQIHSFNIPKSFSQCNCLNIEKPQPLLIANDRVTRLICEVSRFVQASEPPRQNRESRNFGTGGSTAVPADRAMNYRRKPILALKRVSPSRRGPVIDLRREGTAARPGRVSPRGRAIISPSQYVSAASGLADKFKSCAERLPGELCATRLSDCFTHFRKGSAGARREL